MTPVGQYDQDSIQLEALCERFWIRPRYAPNEGMVIGSNPGADYPAALIMLFFAHSWFTVILCQEVIVEIRYAKPMIDAQLIFLVLLARFISLGIVFMGRETPVCRARAW
jgi:hypothetical protein